MPYLNPAQRNAAGNAITKPTKPDAATPKARKDVRRWDATTDLLVMGSGAGGISAALEARRNSIQALVLEKFHVPGGSSSLSGGVCYLGGGTALQKALGFTDTVEDMYRYMMAASGLYADEKKIQLYCEGSVAHFDWLVSNGVHYAQKFSEEKEISIPDGSLYYCGSELVHPYREQARPAPRGHVPPSPHLIGGRDLMFHDGKRSVDPDRHIRRRGWLPIPRELTAGAEAECSRPKLHQIRR